MSNIHVRLDYDEAISARKNILVSQKELLELVKSIKFYAVQRKKEFTLKNKLKRNLANLRVAIIKIEKEMPAESELQLPKGHNKDHRVTEVITLKKVLIKKKGRPRTKSTLNDQIEEIQEKLAKLG